MAYKSLTERVPRTLICRLEEDKMARKELNHKVSFFSKAIATLLTFQVFAPAAGCPPKENIFPQCTCTTGIVISCNIKTVEDIPVWAFRGYSISRLELTMSQTANKFTFGRYFFMGLTIKFIELKSFSLATLDLMKDFEGLEKSLTGLSVITSSIDNVTSTELQQLNKEFSLFLTLTMEGSMCLLNDDINYIGIPNIKTFTCTGNSGIKKADKAPNYMLSDLSKLEKVDLGGVGFTGIERNVFPSDASKLKIINLRDNQLTKLEVHLFERMPALREVYLQGNKLTTIEKNIFQPVWNQLTHLYVNCNSVVCDCDVAWILYNPKKPANFIPPTRLFKSSSILLRFKCLEMFE
ncbi:leucine-rich repeats and immunoglobulin-like domains protein sma-10 isoform X2 [Limulus polyphemus]|uniref:Leucine-rich repeats and immunoglobulin-like domains protein sma-10 isoform X2 n=1 Tax=Limulus polyphemus TaxID=6850 RepID=A0ABM1S4I3_LIMPO|nr:leucine-rich repeats and immunoglobulin-like domains protein sma-10 isoform X2 [Limulus polyphemus]